MRMERKNTSMDVAGTICVISLPICAISRSL